jgi:F-type H+-transporting ATPase subunit epsilon
MAETFLLEVVTPQSVVVSADVEEMSAQGAEGEFGVLPGHTFFCTAITPGELSYRMKSNGHFLVLGEGFAEVTHDRVTILVDSAKPK